MKILYTIVSVIISMSAYSQTEWSVLKNKNYTIEYPSNWSLSEAGEMGSKFMITSPLSSEDDKFAENVNLIVQSKKTAAVTFDEFVANSRKQMAAIIPEFKMLKDENLKTENQTNHMSYLGLMRKEKLKIEQYIIDTKSDFYILTFTMSLNDENDYNEIAKKILDSFKIIK